MYPEIPHGFCIFHLLSNIKSKFKKNSKKIKECFFSAANPNDVLFEVHNGDRKAIVDIGLRTCTCNRFQLNQLPCGHAIVILQKANHDLYDYCSPYFTKEAMIHAYEETVFTVGHEDT